MLGVHIYLTYDNFSIYYGPWINITSPLVDKLEGRLLALLVWGKGFENWLQYLVRLDIEKM